MSIPTHDIEDDVWTSTFVSYLLLILMVLGVVLLTAITLGWAP